MNTYIEKQSRILLSSNPTTEQEKKHLHSAVQDIHKLKFNHRAGNEHLHPAKHSRIFVSSNSITQLEMNTYNLQSIPGYL